MTDTPNFRALAQELNTLLVYVASTHPDLHQTVRRAVLHCSDRARQELATPPPEPPTDEELLEIRDGAYCPGADEINDENDSIWQYTSDYINWLHEHGTTQEQQEYEVKGLRMVFNAGRQWTSNGNA